MALRTGRVSRWIKDANGTTWAVIEPVLSPAETEAAADALVASLPADDRREVEAERLRWALARVRARRAGRRRTPQMVHQQPVFHRGDHCSQGGCPACDERLRA